MMTDKSNKLIDLANAISRAKQVFSYGDDVTIAYLINQCCDTHAVNDARIAELEKAIEQARYRLINIGVVQEPSEVKLIRRDSVLEMFDRETSKALAKAMATGKEVRVLRYTDDEKFPTL